MKIGYVRVSTTDQNTARQDELMKTLGVERVFIDRLSGKDTNRPQFQEMMSFIRAGDTLVVESYSRLSRSTTDLLKIVDELNEKGVQFISQKEQIDTTTPAGKFMLSVFASIYQFERETLLERQKEGIKIAKEQGKYRGRKRIEVDWDQFKTVYTVWKSGECKAVEAAKELGLEMATFYRRVKEFEKANPALSRAVKDGSKESKAESKFDAVE